MIEYQICGVKQTEEEKRAILELYRSVIGSEGCTWSEDYPSEETFNTDISKGNVFCMVNDSNEIIAAISIDEDKIVAGLPCWSESLSPSGELARLVVRADYQNKGIARKMIAYGMEVLKRRGYAGVHFLVSKTNDKALASYKKLNFDCVGEVFLFEHDWWCYEKKLS